MRVWRGTAPLSSKGDWTHGPLLQLKFNPHGSTKEISDSDVKSIGKAYSLASTILAFVLDQLRDHASEAKYPQGFYPPKYIGDLAVSYFSDGFDWAHVFNTLHLTYKGLKNNSQDNLLYLFTKTSKPDQAGAGGYVAHYSGNPANKAHRPPSTAFGKTDKRSDISKPIIQRRRGHLHLNLGVVRKEPSEHLARTIIHEGTHLFAGTGDFAYKLDGARFGNLSQAEQMNNADSYAHFCGDAWNLLHG